MIILAYLSLMVSSAAADIPKSGTTENLDPNDKPVAIKSFHIAPEFSVSFPQPLQVGAEMGCVSTSILCKDSLKYFVDGGYFQYPLITDDRSLRVYSAQIGARWYPWSFLFLGLSAGYRHVSYWSSAISVLKVDDEQLASSVAFSFSTFFLGPSLGTGFWISKSVYLSFDVGLQIPVIGLGAVSFQNSSNDTNSGNSNTLQVDTGTSVNRIASLLIPQVTLFRLIWNLN